MHSGTSLHNPSNRLLSFLCLSLSFPHLLLYFLHQSAPRMLARAAVRRQLCALLAVRPYCSKSNFVCLRSVDGFTSPTTSNEIQSTAALHMNGFGYSKPLSEQNHRNSGIKLSHHVQQLPKCWVSKFGQLTRGGPPVTGLWRGATSPLKAARYGMLRRAEVNTAVKPSAYIQATALLH